MPGKHSVPDTRHLSDVSGTRSGALRAKRGSFIGTRMWGQTLSHPKIKIQKESWVFHQEDILSFYSAHLLISFLPLGPNKGKIPPAALRGRPLATLGIWPNYLCTTGTQIFHFPHGGLASDRKSTGYKQPALCLQGGWEGPAHPPPWPSIAGLDLS